MSSPYLGEIRMFAGNFAPAGWAFCQGQTMQIADNQTLFALIGTTYGGDGQTTFNLPDLRSRVPVHVGPGFGLGEAGGEEAVTLTVNQIPAHAHVPQASTSPAATPDPAGNLWATAADTPYSASAPAAALHPLAVNAYGGNQPHYNMLPYLALNFIIALQGDFPTQA